LGTLLKKVIKVVIVFPGLTMFFYITTRFIVTLFIALCSKTITYWSDFWFIFFWFHGTLPIMVLLASASLKIFHKIFDQSFSCPQKASTGNVDQESQQVPASFLCCFLISVTIIEITFWIWAAQWNITSSTTRFLSIFHSIITIPVTSFPLSWCMMSIWRCWALTYIHICTVKNKMPLSVPELPLNSTYFGAAYCENNDECVIQGQRDSLCSCRWCGPIIMIFSWFDPCGFRKLKPRADAWDWQRLRRDYSGKCNFGLSITALIVVTLLVVVAIVLDAQCLGQHTSTVNDLREEIKYYYRQYNLDLDNTVEERIRFFDPRFLCFATVIRAIAGFIAIPMLTMFYGVTISRACRTGKVESDPTNVSDTQPDTTADQMAKSRAKYSRKQLCLYFCLLVFFWGAGWVSGLILHVHWLPTILQDEFSSGYEPFQTITTSPSSTICENKIHGISIWELSALPMLAQTDGSVMDWLIDYLNLRVPDINVGQVNRFEFPNGHGSFPMIVSNRSGTILAAFPGCHDKVDLSVLIGSTVWAVFRKFVFSPLIPLWDLLWGPILDPFLRLLDEYLIIFITGPSRVVMRYRLVGDLAVEFANQYYNDTKLPHILVGHGPSGLLVKAYAAHTTTNGTSVPEWDGITFDTPYFQHSPVTELQDLRERTGYFIRNFVSAFKFITMGDPSISGDIELPTISLMTFTDPYQTFCLLSAACISTNALDDLCSQMLNGRDIYDDYFRAWGRELNRQDRPDFQLENQPKD
jgi:hypothetical protein